MFRMTLSMAVLSALLLAQPTAAQTRPAAPTSVQPTAATSLVNINSASATDLQSLPGIGAKMAQLIVEYRQKNGPFKKVEELMNVRGIGETNFLKLKPQITVAQAKTDR